MRNVIELDSSLKHIELVHSSEYVEDKADEIARIVGDDELIHSSSSDLSFFTKGFMEYLDLAYNKHKGAVISPEIIWLVILNEIATIVAERPETFRHLFTNSDEKEEILVESDSKVLPIYKIIEQLKLLCPSDIEMYFPDLEIQIAGYNFASHAAFADIVSPFYSYSMFMCGIPKVAFLGNDEDWYNILASLYKIECAMNDNMVSTYFARVRIVIQHFLNKDVEVLKKMFFVEMCGSGGQVEVFGWIRDLYYLVPPLKYTFNYATSISKVDYKCLTEQKDYSLYTGLMSATLDEDDFLIPNIDLILVEKAGE